MISGNDSCIVALCVGTSRPSASATRNGNRGNGMFSIIVPSVIASGTNPTTGLVGSMGANRDSNCIGVAISGTSNGIARTACCFM